MCSWASFLRLMYLVMSFFVGVCRVSLDLPSLLVHVFWSGRFVCGILEASSGSQVPSRAVLTFLYFCHRQKPLLKNKVCITVCLFM